MLYSPKCPRGCLVAKGQWQGEHPAHPHRCCIGPTTWRLCCRSFQIMAEKKIPGTTSSRPWRPTSALSMVVPLEPCWLWFAAPKWQRSFHGIGAGRRSYVPGLLNSWTACLSWAGATEATRVWGGAATKAQDALRLSELAWIVPWEAQQLPASRHWDATPWGATSVKQEMQTFRGSRTSAGWCPLLHAYCWKKVWLSEVPCQHTTSSQHVRVCLVGLETTSNTARGVFGPFPVDYVTESLFYRNGKHFCVQNHVFTTMAAFLKFCFWRILFYLPPTFLRNPVILVQFPHPRVPGCSWSPCSP